uniref:Retrotransposon gag domain-containing protein n=1 Tax=Lactuca sativa TaxID=4236 RepID=A0A9R1VXT9_LACSA|nr:hypothetical protein LSAT_V11C300149710 [Lactuca sativa]
MKVTWAGVNRTTSIVHQIQILTQALHNPQGTLTTMNGGVVVTRGSLIVSHLYLMEKLIPFWHQHGSWRSREHFDTSKCTDEDKVIYAATMLKGEAIHWWGTVKEVRGVRRPRRCNGMISPSNGGQTVRGRILEVGIREHDCEGVHY